jgi:hypothetical protein
MSHHAMRAKLRPSSGLAQVKSLAPCRVKRQGTHKGTQGSFPKLPSNNSKLHLDYLDYLDLISTQGSFPASCISTHVRSRVSKKAAPFHTAGALMWTLGRS